MQLSILEKGYFFMVVLKQTVFGVVEFYNVHALAIM